MSNASVEIDDLLPEAEETPATTPGRRGLKPGQTTSTSFKPGDQWNGNRHGCYGAAGKTSALAVMRKARSLTIEHLDTLNAIIEDDAQPAAARVAAYRELRSLSRVDDAITRSERETEALTAFNKLSDADLEQLINREINVIEGEAFGIDAVNVDESEETQGN